MARTVLLLEMPEIAREREVKFAIYFDDHAKPHVHAIHGRQQVKIEIATLATVGELPAQKMSFAKAWVKANRDVLNEFWSALAKEVSDPANADPDQRRVLKRKLKSPVIKRRAPRKKAPARRTTRRNS